MDRIIDVLIVEDSEDDVLLLLRALKKGGFDVRHAVVDNLDDMKRVLDEQQWTIVLSDHAMPKFSANEALELLNDRGMDLPFIIVSGAIGEEKAVEAMRAGADDFVMKNNLLRLVPVVKRVLLENEERRARKLAEERLAQAISALAETNRALACSNAELKQFVCVASHDLKEPLRMVTSYLQLLEWRYKDRLDDDAQEFIGYAVDGAKRMHELIVALLTYSSIDAKVKPEVPVDCMDVVKKVLETFKTGIKNDDVVVTYDELHSVKIDSVELFQLFQNLIGNAIKFRGKEKPRIHISAKRDKINWVYSVSDNGIGIEPDYTDKIFVMFQRLHSREEYTGTGIGLSICKKIVEKHGGRIWLESEYDKGSTFYFMLPNNIIIERSKENGCSRVN